MLSLPLVIVTPLTMATAALARQVLLLLGGQPSHSLRKRTLVQTTKAVLPSTHKLGVVSVPIVRRRIFSIQAANEVSESGSVDSSLIQTMEMKIKEQLDAVSVTVKDAYGDGRHVSIDVISSVFEGQSTLNRQRMVYKAIWDELQNTVHAVDQMTTRTPAEASK